MDRTKEKKIGYITKRSSERWFDVLFTFGRKFMTAKSKFIKPKYLLNTKGGKEVTTYAVVLVPVQTSYMNRAGEVMTIPIYGRYNKRPPVMRTPRNSGSMFASCSEDIPNQS